MSSFQIKQGDTSPAFQTTLTDPAGAAVDLTGNKGITFRMRRPGSSAYKVDAAATVVSPGDGTVRYVFSADDTDTDGVYLAEWVVTNNDDSVETYPNEGHDVVHIEREA